MHCRSWTYGREITATAGSVEALATSAVETAPTSARFAGSTPAEAVEPKPDAVV
jgi:hypothetical protein